MGLADGELLLTSYCLLRLQTECLWDGLRHLLALSIEQTLRHITLAVFQTVVLHLSLNHEFCYSIRLSQFGIDKCTEGRHTHQSLLLKPDITIDASSFIEPPFLK